MAESIHIRTPYLIEKVAREQVAYGDRNPTEAAERLILEGIEAVARKQADKNRLRRRKGNRPLAESPN